jgi:hypothetical protein
MPVTIIDIDRIVDFTYCLNILHLYLLFLNLIL